MASRIYLILFVVLYIACDKQIRTDTTNSVDMDLSAIKIIQGNYVKNWLDGNREGVLNLFTSDARIQPNSLCPIDSLNKIRNFWFPDDGSKTTIDHFEIKNLATRVEGDTAYATGISFLEWTYVKDTIKFRVHQKGVETTVYVRQKDLTWKIWRQIWTDLFSNRMM